MIGELEEKQRDREWQRLRKENQECSDLHAVGSQKGRALSGAVRAWDKPSRAPCLISMAAIYNNILTCFSDFWLLTGHLRSLMGLLEWLTGWIRGLISFCWGGTCNQVLLPFEAVFHVKWKLNLIGVELVQSFSWVVFKLKNVEAEGDLKGSSWPLLLKNCLMLDADSLPSFGYLKTAVPTVASKINTFKENFVPYFKGEWQHMEKLPCDTRSSLKTFFLVMMINSSFPDSVAA